MIYLQNVTNQLPDAFTNLPKVTKSYNPAAIAQVRVDIPIRQLLTGREMIDQNGRRQFKQN